MNYQLALQILGLSQGFSAGDLKRAYRRGAHKHHPDKGGNADEFKKVLQAYEFLQKLPTGPRPMPADPFNPGFSYGVTMKWSRTDTAGATTSFSSWTGF